MKLAIFITKHAKLQSQYAHNRTPKNYKFKLDLSSIDPKHISQKVMTR